MTASDDLRALGKRALDFVPEGGTIGLGTGHAATAFIQALGERVHAGLKIRGVPTSQASADLAQQLGIPLVTLEEAGTIDVDLDGADEVDPAGNLIKGYGGALVREKIVAASSRRLVILVGAEKLVPVLGSHGKLPVEVLPFGLALCSRRLTELGCEPTLRLRAGEPWVTDNGNLILDCHVAPIEDPKQLELAIWAIPGVVDSGLFLNMTHAVVIQRDGTVEVRLPGSDR